MQVSKMTPTGREGKQEPLGGLVSIGPDLPGYLRVRCHYGYVVMTEKEADRIAAWVLQRGREGVNHNVRF